LKTIQWSVAPLAIAAMLVCALPGCGEKSEKLPAQVEPHDFELALDWFPNADHVAVYEAREQGYFGDVGLRVKPHVPSDPASPIKEVAAGRVDLAISYEPEVFLAREQGLPVVAVAALVQRPLTSLMAIARKRIHGASDLEGKRVGTAGIPYQSAYLKTILERARVKASSVKETNVGASLLPAMLSGKVDATLGAFWNVEGLELERRAGVAICPPKSASSSPTPRCARARRVTGRTPTIIPVDQLGVPRYDELVLVANSDKLADKRDDLRLFIGALAKGARQARKDPRGAAQALLDANPDLKPRITRASVDVTLPVLFPERASKPWGDLDPQQWRTYGAWMFGRGLLKQRPLAAQTLTNDLLPGEGL
jgi:putative hydroxymethylpyrimidine transport system substrate-binding protein